MPWQPNNRREMDGCRVVERTKMLRAKPASIAYGEPKMRTYTYAVLHAIRVRCMRRMRMRMFV